MPRKQQPSAVRTGGITQRQAQTVAGRLQALQAAGYPMTKHLQWVLRCCQAKGGADA